MNALTKLRSIAFSPTRLAATLLLAATLPITAQAATISLSTSGEVTTAFPSTFHPSTGSSLDFDGTKHLKLHAATANAGTEAVANAYSAQSYSNSLNFFSGDGVTLTFNDVGLLQTVAGAGYNFSLGIASNNSGSFSGSAVGQKVYFYIDRGSYTVSLRQRSINSAAQTLASWTLKNTDWVVSGDGLTTSVSLTSLSLTLTPTTWSATVKGASVSQVNETLSGNLTTTLLQSDWANYYIGLQTSTGATLTDRYADGFIGSIDINSIPEPASAAMLFGVGALVVVGTLRRQRRS